MAQNGLSGVHDWYHSGEFFGEQYAIDHTQITDGGGVPDIIGWSGPGRSGTTALLFLLASQSRVDRAYFQPQKSLIRQGGPDFILHGTDSLVCTKEVFGAMHPEENYDPIGHLLKAGVPPEKISWITVLRDPVDTYGSWYNLTPESTPQHFARSQGHALNIYDRYRDVVNSIPFAYDLLGQGEGPGSILEAALSSTALEGAEISLEFDRDSIEAKVELGQAANPEYFEKTVAATVARGEFSYVKTAKPLPQERQEAVVELCGEAYDNFFSHSAEVLGVEVDLQPV